MTIQKKTLIIIAVTLVCLLAGLYLGVRFILLRGFDDYEMDRARSETALIRRSYLARLNELDVHLQQLSAWDAMASYVQHPTPEFEESNFVNNAFESLELNAVVVLDRTGRVVFARGYDLLERRTQPISPGLMEVIEAIPELQDHDTARSARAGLISLPEDPMLVASRPIVSSNFDGPIRGTLILGRYADGTLATRCGDLLKRSVTALRWQDVPPEVQAGLADAAGIYVRPMSRRLLEAYARVNDIIERPALALRTELPREAYAAKVILARTLMASLLAAGLVFGTVVMLLLRYSVLLRVASLESEVRGIADSGDARRRVALSGRDELARLAESVNVMLAALAASREALRSSEETSRALMDATLDSAFLATRDGTLVAVNEAGARRLGMNREEITGAKLRDLFLPALAEARMARLEEAFETGRAVRFEDRRGDIRFDVTYYPVANAEGRIDRLAIFAHDITDMRKAEEELRESRARYRDLVQSVNSIVLRWDLNGVVTFVNEYGQQFFGWTWQELVGKPVVGTIVPEVDSSGQDLRGFIDALLREPEKYVSNENENIRKNGERVWIAWSNRPVFDDTGALVEILSIGNDITRRRLVEQSLVHRVQMEELAASVSARFLTAGTGDLSGTMQEVLRSVGEFAGADRAYFYLAREDGKTLDLVHEWCAPGVVSPDRPETGLSAERYTWFAEKLRNDGVVYIRDAAELPEEAAAERALLDSWGMRSLLDVPLLWRGQVVGILGFSGISQKADWDNDDIRLLKLVAGVFVAAFQRARAEEAVLVQARRLEALINLQDMGQSGPREMMGFVLQKAVDLTRSDLGFVSMLNGRDEAFVPDNWARADEVDDALPVETVAAALETPEMWDRLKDARKPLVLDRASLPGQAAKYITRLLAVPILDHDRLEAMAVVVNKPFEYDEADANQLQLLMSGAWNQIKRNEAVAWIQREVDEIANIQRALLPRSMPTVQGMRVRAFSSTFDRAGGDYYDVLPVGAPPGTDLKQHPRWLILIADVSGHGPSSAVIVAILSTLLRVGSVEGSSPARVLEYLNGQLMGHTAGQVFVTAFLALIDLDARTLVYSNAGHNPPVVRRPDGTVTELERSGDIPLGIMTSWTYSERTIPIERDAVLWLYTDGVVETRSADGEAFGEQRLRDAIQSLEGESSRAVAELVGMLRAHEAGRRPSDDQVIMLVEFT
ncbi:MAG TPA: SpoIIE family protein phosphatase [Candidatus Hydrogenedentes bacterium]|jgi:PAS domain S-box-containing protein|nr:SpoIIE family protein phosphatase [Candidatus Hydrogenedentota bacterium]HPJ98910.1 SpoIIE family protein phosphatase [Candidatus Hydrogenedentota bacterium]